MLIVNQKYYIDKSINIVTDTTKPHNNPCLIASCKYFSLYLITGYKSIGNNRIPKKYPNEKNNHTSQ